RAAGGHFSAGGDHAEDLDLRAGPGRARPGGLRARPGQGRRRRPRAAAARWCLGAAGPVSGREFFTARTVAEARSGFRPAHRTPLRTVPLADALHRVPAGPVPATAALPGFDRSTVDGFAVRAADTFGASEGLPSYFDLLGAVRMGAAPEVAVRPGGCVAVPTG